MILIINLLYTSKSKPLIDFKYIKKIDAYNYYMMNIIDYVIGNDDRHPNNWGVLIDNKTNKILRLYSLMDFNKAFNNYKNNNAICLTTKERITQKEAAIDAINKVGFNLKRKVNKAWFEGNVKKYNECVKRINLLSDCSVFAGNGTKMTKLLTSSKNAFKDIV